MFSPHMCPGVLEQVVAHERNLDPARIEGLGEASIEAGKDVKHLHDGLMGGGKVCREPHYWISRKPESTRYLNVSSRTGSGGTKTTVASRDRVRSTR